MHFVGHRCLVLEFCCCADQSFVLSTAVRRRSMLVVVTFFVVGSMFVVAPSLFCVVGQSLSLLRQPMFVVARFNVWCRRSSGRRSSVVGQCIYVGVRATTTTTTTTNERTNDRTNEEQRTTNNEQRRRPTTAIFLASFLPCRSLIACIPASGYVFCVCSKHFVVSLNGIPRYT